MLCTASQTYTLKNVESSNTLLLVDSPNLQHDISAGVKRRRALVGMHYNYELAVKKARLDNVRAMVLIAGEYKGEREGDDAAPRLSEIESACPGSKEEILEELRSEKLRAVEIRGRWRVLAEDYEEEVVRVLVATVEEQGWDASSFPAEECVKIMATDYEKTVVEHCLRFYAHPVAEGSVAPQKSAPIGRWALNVKGIVRFFGVRLLRKVGKQQQSTFLQAWRAALPEGLPELPSEELTPALLSGFCVQESGQLAYFPHTSLPADPRERFKSLFQCKPKWRGEDMEPFLEGIVTATQTSKRLLLKYARSVQTPDGRMYCTR